MIHISKASARLTISIKAAAVKAIHIKGSVRASISITAAAKRVPLIVSATVKETIKITAKTRGSKESAS